MKPKVCYIELQGKPLCHNEYVMRKFKCTCGYTSIASATKVKQILQAHYYPVRVKVGSCPTLFEESMNVITNASKEGAKA